MRPSIARRSSIVGGSRSESAGRVGQRLVLFRVSPERPNQPRAKHHRAAPEGSVADGSTFDNRACLPVNHNGLRLLSVMVVSGTMLWNQPKSSPILELA